MRKFANPRLSASQLSILTGYTKARISQLKGGGIIKLDQGYFGLDAMQTLKKLKKSKTKNKIQIFANLKGGVGKTTLSSQYTMMASLMGFKVLAIDLDPQAQLTHQLSGENLDFNHLTMYDAIIGERNIEDCILKSTELIDFIPSNLGLTRIENPLLNKFRREYLLQTLLHKVIDDYDLIVIDTNPTPSILNISAYVASNLIVVPCVTDYLPAHGLGIMLDNLLEIDSQLETNLNICIVPNKHNKKQNIRQEALDSLIKHYSPILSNTIIRGSTQIKEATKNRDSVFFQKKNSSGYVDILNLTKELIGK